MDNCFTEKIAPKNKPENPAEKQDKQENRQAQNKHNNPRPENKERRNRDRDKQKPSQPKPQNNAPAPDNGVKVEIIGVRFKDVGKVYYFSPNGVQFKQGEKAIVETARGIECGEIMLSNRMVPECSIVSPLKSIIRKATDADVRQMEENRKKEREIMQTFAEKIALHKLDMKPIDVDCTFDGSKILFYFTSDGRVDFRELVKDLAGIYRTRIELRQIGVRDEAKMLGGLGICGRPFCCSSFLVKE